MQLLLTRTYSQTKRDESQSNLFQFIFRNFFFSYFYSLRVYYASA